MEQKQAESVIKSEAVNDSKSEANVESVTPKVEKMLEKSNGEKQMSLPDTIALATEIYKSRYFNDIGNPQQAVAKILAGRELGIGAMISLAKVYVVNGKVAIQAELMAGLIKRSGKYDYRVKELTNDKCGLVFFEKGHPIGELSFTIEDAKKAGVASKDNWQKYPKNMLFARALSNGARWYCPDAIHGAYTYEEMNLEVDMQGSVIQQVPEIKVTGTTPKPESKVVEAEVVQNRVIDPDRKEYIDSLKKEFGLDKMKAVKKQMEIKEKLTDIEDNVFSAFVKKLATK